MPGSSIFILLLVFDYLSVQIALGRNKWFYQYSQQNIFGIINVKYTATDLESLASWPWNTTSLRVLTQRMNERCKLSGVALYIREKETWRLTVIPWWCSMK